MGDSTYYRFRELQTEVDGHTFRHVTRPALGKLQERLNPGQLLAQWARVSPEAQALLVHCDTGLVGLSVLDQLETGHLIMLDAHLAAIECARQTLWLNGIDGVSVQPSDCAQAVHGQTFDCVLALLPKSRAVWEQTVVDAATLLRDGGDFFLAGANNAGIKSAAKHVEKVFGNVHVVAYRAGCRVLRAVKGLETRPPASEYYAWSTIQATVRDHTFSYVSKPGIFSWQRLDDGSRMLIEAMQDQPLRADDQVLDIGCGAGVLTLVAAQQAHEGHVTGVDADCRAVEATRRTLALGEATNAEALLSDCVSAVSDRAFSAVVTNPPFHKQQSTSYATARQIIHDAHQVLRKRGRFYLVANAFLKYQPLIEETFGNVQLLRQNNRYRVWYATKQR